MEACFIRIRKEAIVMRKVLCALLLYCIVMISFSACECVGNQAQRRLLWKQVRPQLQNQAFH